MLETLVVLNLYPIDSQGISKYLYALDAIKVDLEYRFEA